MRHLRLFAFGLASTALFSCGGDDLVLPGEGEPAEITIVQGNGLSGRVGEALAKPLIVEVLDIADRPVAGATVVIDLSGAVAEPDTLSTDALGRASAEITLGSQVGEAAGAARVIAPASPATVEADFTVMALASSANGMAGVSGDGQTGPAGTALPNPLVVEVTDAFGNPITGAPITWAAEGGGSVSETSTTTDAQGLTSVTRTLGPTAGIQTTLATSGGLAGSPVTFTHTVTAGNPSGVMIVDGNGQTGAPGTTLPKDLVVEVVDGGGNPVVAAAVTWVMTAGGGTLAPATGTTDANGRTTTKWTLGPTVGTNTAQAIVSGVGQAEFTATAAAGTASEIRVVSGNGQIGQAGGALAAPLVVQLLDDGDNPVGGVTVTWAVESGAGSVSPPSVATAANGQASATWTLGMAIGAQRVLASAPGAGSVRFEATSTVGAPSALRLAAQPSTRSAAGVPFRRQPVVQVLDAAGNPVQAPGVAITAAIATGSGQLIGTTTRTTDANGRAAFTNIGIAGAIGAHSLIFAAAGFTSVTSATITVNPAGTTTQIISDEPEPSLSGELVAVDFEVVSPAGAPTGTVVVTASGGPETCSVDVAVGQCSIILTVTGDRTLTASFQGSTLFNASLDTTPHRVDVPSVPPTAGNDGTGP
jgi:adhesin/invasin